MIADNKRIAKNSIYLYLRSFIAMAISVYTSRIVLQALGVIDFGIYNIVVGVVASLSMVTGPIEMSVSRFISYTIGKNDDSRLNSIVSVSVNIIGIISLIVLILGWSVGHLIIYDILNIPLERQNAAYWTYNIVIITFAISILQIPLRGLIIANERMNFYALLGIIEAILKLCIAYLILITSYDSLVLYSIFLTILSVTLLMLQFIYYKKNFPKVKYVVNVNKSMYKEMFSFVSFTILTGITFIMKNQGVDVLLNIFFGPIVNAAKAIAGQVQNAASVLGNGLQTASAPQIVKKYSKGEFADMSLLIFRIMRFSSFLMLITIFPIYLNTDYIVNLWLGNIPHYSVEFIRISLLIVFMDTLSLPLHNGILACGKIKTYSILISIIQMLTLPVCFLLLKIGNPPIFVMYLLVMTSILLFLSRYLYLNRLVKISFSKVVIPNLLPVFCVFGLVYVLTRCLMIQNNNFICFISNILVELLLVIVMSLIFGCKRSERRAVVGKIRRLVSPIFC